MREHPRVHRRHAGQVGGAVSGDLVLDVLRPEPFGQHDGRPGEQRCDELVVHAVGMVQRHQVQQAIRRGQPRPLDDARRVPQQVAVGEQGALWQPRAARGQLHHRQIGRADRFAGDRGACRLARLAEQVRREVDLHAAVLQVGRDCFRPVVEHDPAQADGVCPRQQGRGREAGLDEAGTGTRLHDAEEARNRVGRARRGHADQHAANNSSKSARVAVDARTELGIRRRAGRVEQRRPSGPRVPGDPLPQQVAQQAHNGVGGGTCRSA